MRVAVILVHYRTPELAAAAVAALRADAAQSGLEIEGILVDNGSDEAGRALLEALPFERIDPQANLGFAGGVNLGVGRSRAERIVVMNPDVRVLPGCLGALLDALSAGAAVAGPRFYWDDARRMLLPPAEERSRAAEILSLLATRGERWAARARRRWRRHARRHWQAVQPLASYALSGSLLAFSRAAWERIGPFDEGYRLYFEETDWLRRAARLGLPARYVPAAAAVHLHARSAVQEPRSGGWFEESARRFRERHYGRWFNALLEGLAGRPPRRSPARSAVCAQVDLSGLSFPLWIEVSPNPTGFPAAAERLVAPPEAPWRLPPEVAERLAGAELTLQVADSAGRELARRVLAERLL
ncbi:MAG TPA: glycosyltransferase family 2 protein [Thermoanaerobaculia bacterium]|jgi:GT2 family glycosyltransferase